jgi:hypothetical protein
MTAGGDVDVSVVMIVSVGGENVTLNAAPGPSISTDAVVPALVPRIVGCARTVWPKSAVETVAYPSELVMIQFIFFVPAGLTS